jgi:MYXO-CTERM domain-containing protein
MSRQPKLTIWSEGSNEVGQISGVGPVLASQGTGWKGYDATTPVLAALTRGDSSISFTVDYVGYTGFQFSSAECGKPAHLQFTTAAPVPEAESVALALAGLGLVGLVHLRRRRAG